MPAPGPYPKNHNVDPATGRQIGGDSFLPETTTVFLTMRNADTTEGRGPMVHDKAFLQRDHAVEYIDRQPGVMGRQAKWSQEKYGDWRIEPLVVYMGRFTEAAAQEELRRAAYEKAKSLLSSAELTALGLA